jgi:CheY-like chemotaxis protein
MDSLSFQGTIPSILVVDDDEVIRLLLHQFLEGAGYHVEDAADGYEALDKIAGGSFDLVIMDIAMPGIDGPGVCEQIRTSMVNPPPVLMITALDDE